MLPRSLQERLQAVIGTPVAAQAPVGGGCIANAARVEAGGDTLFVKWGEDEVARTFEAEAAGLRALRAAGSPLVVPAVVASEPPEEGRPGFLVMEWLAEGPPGGTYWATLGQGLATLHRATAEAYGLSLDNFIGRLPQSNRRHDAWPEFFQAERLEPQVERARRNGRWQRAWERGLGGLYARLEDLLPGAPPASILHGDLWSGNVLATAAGQAALIDPAVYYGHREVDLAMTELFGGFDAAFYAAYRQSWPLEAGYEERRDVYNLYHLINHLNHFGGGYAGSVASVLRRFA